MCNDFKFIGIQMSEIYNMCLAKLWGDRDPSKAKNINKEIGNRLDSWNENIRALSLKYERKRSTYMSVNKINKRNKGASTQEEWQEYAPQEC